jgi:hypothetical protein
MLEGVKGAQEVVEACRPFVTDSIWIGKMNRIGERCFGVPETTLKAIDNLQCDAAIMQLYWLYERDGLIRWKDSIKKVIERRPA